MSYRVGRPTPPATSASHRAARRGRHLLLTAAAALAAAGAAVQGWHAATFLGSVARGDDRVADTAAGSVAARLGRGIGRKGRATTTTFDRAARGGAHGDGRIDADGVRDGVSGVGRVAVLREDRARTALTVREQLELGAPGTYIRELLLRRDSALTRWPDRPARPLAVFVGSGAHLADWRPEYVRQVASAFAAWARAGVPLGFQFVDDSTRADVHVGWTDRFSIPISGRTVWSRDDRWWMLDAQVTLALHHSDGAPLDADQMRALAMHEVGHLLGLDHTTDSTNVMAPRVRVRELSSADQATARLLYSVPAGRVR